MQEKTGKGSKRQIKMRQIELSQKSPPCIVLLAVTLRGRSNIILLNVAMTVASCHFPCSCPCISRHSQAGVRPPFFGTPLQAEQAPQERYPEVGLCSSEAKDRVSDSTVSYCLDLGAPLWFLGAQSSPSQVLLPFILHLTVTFAWHPPVPPNPLHCCAHFPKRCSPSQWLCQNQSWALVPSSSSPYGIRIPVLSAVLWMPHRTWLDSSNSNSNQSLSFEEGGAGTSLNFCWTE